MKTGLVIYARSVSILTRFYTHVFGLEVTEQDDRYARLVKGEFELVLLETQQSQQQTNELTPREHTPLKPTFFVSTPLEVLAEKVEEQGGSVFEPKDWQFGGRQVCDGYDSEGNIFQLRIG